jgi:hypothetical protein
MGSEATMSEVSKGRTWTALAAVTAAVAIGAALAWRAQAQAETTKVGDLKAACQATEAYHRRAVLLRDLSEIDSDAARDALAALADAKDETLAVQALATLGRMDAAAATAKLEKVVTDTKRSEFVRSMALTAWTRSAHRSQTSKATAAAKFDDACRKNQALADAATAVQTNLWGKE